MLCVCMKSVVFVVLYYHESMIEIEKVKKTASAMAM